MPNIISICSTCSFINTTIIIHILICWILRLQQLQRLLLVLVLCRLLHIMLLYQQFVRRRTAIIAAVVPVVAAVLALVMVMLLAVVSLVEVLVQILPQFMALMVVVQMCQATMALPAVAATVVVVLQAQRPHRITLRRIPTIIIIIPIHTTRITHLTMHIIHPPI